MKSRSTIRDFDFKNSSEIEIEIIDLAKLKDSPRIFDGHNKANFFQLIWIKSGELRLDVDFLPVKIYEGELFLISINQVYSFHTNSECEGKLILFTNDFFNLTELDNHLLHWSDFFNPLYLSPTIRLNNEIVTPFIQLLEQELSFKNDFFQPYIAQSFLRILLLRIERSLNKQPVTMIEHLDLRIGRRFCEAVGKGFKENHNVSHYQQELGVSEKILIKEVKEFTGKTPKEYLDARIILEAKRLLHYGKNLSIKEVSIEIGFDEPTNFNKFFKKHTGMTPVQFKSSEQGK